MSGSKASLLTLIWMAGALSVDADAQVIQTYAGGGSFNNAPAAAVSIAAPLAISLASDGTLYVASQASRLVHVGLAAQTATVVAGTGTAGYGGDGGPAASAGLDVPTGVAVDANGNVYFSDSNNQRVRRIDSVTGIIATVAGNGGTLFGGDGGLATAAGLLEPSGLAFDAAGDLYVADSGNHRIRRIDHSSGVITTIAGNGTAGYSGDGGKATLAELSIVEGIKFDSRGNLYLADNANYVVRRVDANGIITTVAGNGQRGSPVDGVLALAAGLSNPYGLSFDASDNLYIADGGAVRRVDASTNLITTVAGTGAAGYGGDGGPATAALVSAFDIAIDAAGNLYIADEANNRIRRVDAQSKIITTVAGNGFYSYSGDGGPANTSQLGGPQDVARDSAGNIFIADTVGFTVRRVDAKTGSISTFAGNGIKGISGDGGLASLAEVVPTGISVDASGNLFISDAYDGVVRRVDASSGLITRVAGVGRNGPGGDGGPATYTLLFYPYSSAVDSAGNLFIAEYQNSKVRRVDAHSGIITTVVGNGTSGYSGDGGPALSAEIGHPSYVIVDGFGNLYISDHLSGTVRFVDATTQIISTLAGNGTVGNGADGIPATSSSLILPTGLSLDGAGNLFIADGITDKIRRIDSMTHVISTVAGNGTNGFAGDGGQATNAELAFPLGVVSDGAGDLFIADANNGRIREVTGLAAIPSFDLSPTSLAFGSLQQNRVSSPQFITLTNTGSVTLPITGVSIGGVNTKAFALTNYCSSLVPVGGSCVVLVAFTPGGTGSKTATVVVAAADGAGTQSVALSGTGIVPTFRLSTTSIDFGSQMRGTVSDPQTVLVINTGGEAVTFKSVTLTGGGQFSRSDGCDAPVRPAAACSIQIQFKPTLLGNLDATLTIAGGGAAGTQTVSLAGSSVLGSYSLSPSSLAFAAQPRNTASAPQAFTIANTGAVPVTLSSISLGAATEFSQTNDCGSPIAVGSSCTVQVVFAPLAKGTKTGKLSVVMSGGGAGGHQTAAVTGTGT